jgi:hypothetical protein
MFSWQIKNCDLVIAFSQPDHRKSKFGLRHGIMLIELYAMTESEF